MRKIKQNKETILVTGGTGYIGSVLVRQLLDRDCNIIIVDNLTFGEAPLLDIRHQPNFKFIKGDIASGTVIKGIFDDYDIDGVVHLAAIVGDPACARQPRLARRVNLDASLRLLTYSIKNKVKKFIFASTCSNYGKMPDPDSYVDETSPLSPVSLYAELKVKFENILLSEIDKKEDFCPVSLRFATAYGISPRMRFDLTVNEFTKELSMGREVEVFGAQFWRPYCHVYDFARAILAVLDSDEEKKIAYNVFNVGDTSENYQKKTIVEEIKKFIPNAKVRYVEKEDDPRDYRVSFEKIKRGLGFVISRRVPDGIMEIIQLIGSRKLLNPDDVIYRNS